MSAIKNLAKKLQFIDALVPLPWRVPFRYAAQRTVGGLEPEMALLLKLVPKDKAAIDIGGNRGTYAYALSKLAKHVVVFEPLPECARMIQAWAKGRNATVHVCGLGESEGVLNIHVPRLQGSLRTTRASFVRTEGNGVDILLPVKTLDQFNLDEIGFIKIDVEGFEYSALLGARNTLERCHPTLLVEIDAELQSRDDFEKTFKLLEGMGYQGHYLQRDELRPCDSQAYSQKPPVTNFIFLYTVRN